MNKTNDSYLFMSVCVMIILGVLVILRPGRHQHDGVDQNTGGNIDNKLKRLGVALDKANHLVQLVLNHAT